MLIIMKKFVTGLLVMGLTSLMFAQTTELPEVEITAVNYKYLNAVDANDTAINVKKLEEKVAMFDLKNSELYSDEYTYKVSFYIPDGKIVAAYDRNGNIVRIIEKFNNIKLPEAVRMSISKRFPNWIINTDIYRVDYRDGNAKKVYKVLLKNGDEKMRIKIDDEGEFI